MIASVTIAPLRDDLDELSPAAWERLEGVSPMHRTLLLAHGAALENEQLVVAARDASGEVLGLALCTVVDDRIGRAGMITYWVDPDKGLLFARGVDASAVCVALIAKLMEHGRAAGWRKLVLAYFATTNQPVLAAAQQLRFRTMAGTPSYELCVTGSTFEEYLQTRPKKQRYNLRRDERLLAEAGCSVVIDAAPSATWLARCWPLHVEQLARRGDPRRFRANYLVELLERSPPGSLSLCRAMRGEELVGFSLTLRWGRDSLCLCSGQTEERVIYVGLNAHELREELDRGAQRIAYGAFNDANKLRIGCTAQQSRYAFVAL